MKELYEVSKPKFANNNVVKLWTSAEEMRDRICDYFEWNKNNPIKKEEFLKINTEVSNVKIKKFEKDTLNCKRALSVSGAAAAIGISEAEWRKLRNKKDNFGHIIRWAESVINEDNYSGKRAGIYTADIIKEKNYLKLILDPLITIFKKMWI